MTAYVSSAPKPPIPIIDDAEFDYILRVIENLTTAIERSPSAFASMEEEHLRDHILIQLNGHYEGQATGETFNASGKTDILVRVQGRNVFVGECKFWNGEKVFFDAIDQLFRYTCWSDTKAAVVIFNKNRNHTAVLETIRTSTRRHARFKSEQPARSETHLRYVFHHPEDEQRNIYVAVLAINLPTVAQ